MFKTNTASRYHHQETDGWSPYAEHEGITYLVSLPGLVFSAHWKELVIESQNSLG